MSDRLSRALREIAEDGAKVEPPREIEGVLLAEFESARRRRRMVSWTVAAASIAAAVIIAITGGRYERPAAQVPAIAEVSESERPFVPIPYVTPLVPFERTEVVRMELTVSALIAAGLPMSTPDPAARVEADVLVGQDGRARAVRLISVSSFN